MNTLLRRISIRSRLLGSMLLVSALLLALGVWASISYSTLQRQTDELLQAQAAANRDSSAVQAALERVQRHEQSVMLNGNNAVEAGEHKARWDKEVAATAKLLAGDGKDAARTQQLAAGVAGLKAYTEAVGPVLQQVVDAKIDATAAYAYASQALPELEQARSSFAKWLAQTEARVAAEREAARSIGAMQSHLRLAAAALVMGSFCGLMLLLSRSITRPIDEAGEHARRITQGDLSARIADDGHDEVSAFVRSLSEMQQALRKIVGEVRTGAGNIHTASAEVASGNLDLSQRTEHAASNLQETAAAMEELTGMVRRSADSAAQANQMAGVATEVAQRGGKVVSEVVATMDDINQASRKIADIIGVIDGIAFQTNILALNAAVEAARAGEQGRGFAVVAGEVRSLAGRSAEAAREIKTLINASVERVDSGTRLVRDAGSTMDDIVGSVARVTDVIREITGTTSQQSQGLGQINSAVSQLDQMTQQNAALVEQSAAAAESLKHQAHRLVSVVADFKLDEHGQPPPAGPATPSPSTATLPATLPETAHAVAARQALSRARTAAPQAAAARRPAVAPAARASTPAPSGTPTTAETLPELCVKQSAVTAGDDWETF